MVVFSVMWDKLILLQGATYNAALNVAHANFARRTASRHGISLSEESRPIFMVQDQIDYLKILRGEND